jgi:general secretion pathway protein A
VIEDYYKLAEQPFGMTPDTRYLYLSPTHREALASLLYGVQSGRGFMAIIAEPGMGKTTLLFQLLQQLGNTAKTVFLFQTFWSPGDLLRSLLHDLGTEAYGDLPEMHAQLNECMLTESRQGRQIVVVIDEAQNLSHSTLEFLRMLSNFETPHKKLMQIILAGQPQLAEKLASPDLVQLRQRISIVARLKPFTAEETNLYVGHRLRVAGHDFSAPVFTPRAGAMIAEHSEGIPRNINNLCINALSLGCALKRRPIDEKIIREVLDDLDLSENGMKLAISEAGQSSPKTSMSAANAGTRTRGFGWSSSVAMAAIFVLLLLWPVRVGQGILSASPRAPDVYTPESPVKSFLAPKSPALETGNSKVDVSPHPATPSSRHTDSPARKASTTTTELNPAYLWKQLAAGSTSAEIALASLYFDGTVVPQNCSQAQVLLLAAAKKGDKGAEGLRADYEKHCG